MLFPKHIFALLTCFFLFTASAIGQSESVSEAVLTKCWSYPAADFAGESLAFNAHAVFIGFDGAKIEAVSVDGQKVWGTEFGGDIVSNLIATETSLFVVTATVSGSTGKTRENVLRSISSETGIINWTYKMPISTRHFLSRSNGSIIAVSNSGVVQSIDNKTGTVKWSREIAEEFVAEPAFNGGVVSVATRDNQIFVVSLENGQIESVRKFTYGITAIGKSSNGEMVVGDERGNVSSLVNGTEKTNWKFKSGGEISRILAAEEYLLVTSHDNFVYFLSNRRGDVEWKKRLAGRISQIAQLNDDVALITTFEEHGAVAVDLSSGKVAGQLVLADDEIIRSKPLAKNQMIYVLTNKAAYAFSLSGCAEPKKANPGIVPASARLK